MSTTKAVTKLQILSIFKKLHQVKSRVFKNDDRALKIVTERINNDFKKNKDVTDEEEIYRLFKTAEECEKVLRLQVVQLEKVGPDISRVHIREETYKIPNTLLDGSPAIKPKAKENDKTKENDT